MAVQHSLEWEHLLSFLQITPAITWNYWAFLISAGYKHELENNVTQKVRLEYYII